MRRLLLRAGFSAVEIVIAVAVVAVVGFLGYIFYNNYQDKQAAEASAVTDVPKAPAITTTSDLDKASATIDEAVLDSGNDDDLSELDGELAEF
ncbi:MAG: hypothetical protein JWM07_660 [Candidatus Saccharibacteria bacterium]|nr:hypothetical protein [Candidatus Saccharibacteria bacterium]